MLVRRTHRKQIQRGVHTSVGPLEADVVLVIDSDVPWTPKVSRPADYTRIFHLHVDPLKEKMPLCRIAAEVSWRADTFTAQTHLDAWVAAQMIDAALMAECSAHHASAHAARAERLLEIA